MERKYKLLKDDIINVKGQTLYRIKALRDFNDVKKGDLGGYIEKENNLSHENNCWVCDNARVYDNARLYDNAIVNGDDAIIYGNAILSKDAYITNTNEYISIGPIGSRNAITTFYLTKDKTIMVKCGCFNDTIDKFIDKVNETHKDNPTHLNNYIRGIDFTKSFLSR